MSIQASVAVRIPQTFPDIKQEIVDDTSIQKPFGGWKILQEPIPINKDKGIYKVEFNTVDLSTLNDGEKLHSLKNELSNLSFSSKIKHLIISFNRCHSLAPNNADSLANHFIYLKNKMKSNGQKLSLVHLEKRLFENLRSVGIEHFMHATVEDALKDSSILQEEPPKLAPTLHLKLFTGNNNGSLPADEDTKPTHVAPYNPTLLKIFERNNDEALVDSSYYQG